MKNSAYPKPGKVAIEGDFYCPFDPVTRQIRLTIKAASVEEAQQRMAALAHLIGVTKAGELSYVVLEEAPKGVPLYSSGAVAPAPLQVHQTAD